MDQCVEVYVGLAGGHDLAREHIHERISLQVSAGDLRQAPFEFGRKLVPHQTEGAFDDVVVVEQPFGGNRAFGGPDEASVSGLKRLLGTAQALDDAAPTLAAGARNARRRRLVLGTRCV
jgi:hypothetical protein